LTGKTLELPEDDPSITEMTDADINALLEIDIGGGIKLDNSKVRTTFT
jgi:hypothetical protein